MPHTENTYKMGDRVRVTYDTVVVVDANFPISYGVRVVTPVSVMRGDWDDQIPTATVTVPLQYLTRLGPESDPVGTTRIRHGKEFAVAVRRPGREGTTCDWRIVAAKDQTQVGLFLNNYLVKDWDVLGA